MHDPQPSAIIKFLKPKISGVRWLWQCHIGLDKTSRKTLAAWAFLQEYLEMYDYAVFTSTAYIPPFLKENAAILTPAIDPAAPKN